MKVGFFFWPYTVELCNKMARYADEYGYDQVGIADTPGNAMDPWVAAALVAGLNKKSEVSICVSNFVTRQPAVSAAAIASLDLLAPGRTILGIGAGHSGTKNIGAGNSSAQQMADGVTFARELLRGKEVKVGDGTAHMPWIKNPSRVFMASSHPKGLEAAGRVADGVFINYGLQPDNVKESEGVVARGIAASGRSPDDVAIWQIGAMDCTANGEIAREKIGAMLAFIAGYIVSNKDPVTRGVPQQYREAMLNLRSRYSTRPGAQNIQIVKELGLFDYLSKRIGVCGTPDECFEQMMAAKNAGIKRIMFSVSVANDPADAVRLFGEKVLPRVRAAA
jgi:5,10-methylenetetrahydromethanopterin reductase